MLTISLNAVRATYRFLCARRSVDGDPRPVPTLSELCLGLMLIGATGFGG